MKALRSLLSLILAAAFFAPAARAFHVPPWDTGHNSFSGDPGDPGTDPGTDDGCNSCPCTAKTASPVEVSSGNYIYTQRAFSIAGLGPALDLTLTYNSQDLRRGPFGQGWVHSYEQRIIETTNAVDIFAICAQGNGKRERFTKNPDGSYAPPSHFKMALTKAADHTYALRDRRGEVRQFNAEGQLIAVSDRNGNTLTLTYDPTGFMTRMTDAAGRAVLFTKGADGRVESVSDPAGRTFRFNYDGAGNLTRYADPLGNATAYQYDARGNLTAVIDPRGDVLTRLTYDGEGRVSQHLDGAETWTYTYNPSLKRTTKRDSQNFTWTYEYNDNGNVIKKVDPFGKTALYTVDSDLNITQYTDWNGHSVKYTYDSAGNQLGLKDALNNERTTTYEPTFGRPLSVRDASGSMTRFEYDARGNLTKVVNALGQATQFKYDAKGQLTQTTDALGGTTTNSYDAFGDLIQTTDPLGNSRSSTFDVLGRVLTTTDAEGRTAQFTYDDAGRLIQSIDPGGGVVTREYDPAGNLVAVTTPAKGRTTFQYDSLNRMTRSTNPLGQSTAYTYDRRGKPASKVTPNGQTITYVYDALERLTRKNTPDDTITYTYDASGNLLSVADGDSSLSFTYDQLDRLSEAGTGATAGQPATTIRYTYDALGKRKSMTDPSGGVTSYTYDVLQRLASVKDPAGLTFAFSYDPLSRRATTGRPLGLSTSYTYDAAGHLTSLSHQGGPGPLSFNYTYDRVGNRLTKTDPAGTVTYTYDSLYRLTAAAPPPGDSPESYAYDAVGNLTKSHLSSSYAYDAANRLLADDAFDYQYDANGNLTRKTERATAKVTGFVYDAENQLVRVDHPDGTNTTYRYDGMGRRIQKNAGGAATQYVYDDRHILFEYAGANLSARYVYGPGLDEVVAVNRGADAALFQADALGSVVRVVDAGGVKAAYRYESFGRVAAETGTRQSPHAFQGRELDAETGQYYFRYRYYVPSAGRFLQEDPIGLAGGINFYQFVRSNPVNIKDPLGLYGTNDCSYYDTRCADSGGNYYCKVAPDYCNGNKFPHFPKYPDPLPEFGNDFEGWTRCARQCLQDCDRRKNTNPPGTCPVKPDPSTDSFWDTKHFGCHVECYSKCAAWWLGDKIIPPAY